MLEVGRLCMKIAGREAGKYCVVVKKMDENFVMVTGPRELTQVKRRRCNVNHLEPMVDVLKIKSDAADDEVLKAFRNENLVSKLGLEPREKKPEKKAKTETKEEKPKEARKEEKKHKKPEPKKSKPKPAKKPEKRAVKKPATKKAKAPAKKTAKKK